jgi:multisubunit Na+/H+ antiporter MnhB subunit
VVEIFIWIISGWVVIIALCLISTWWLHPEGGFTALRISAWGGILIVMAYVIGSLILLLVT